MIYNSSTQPLTVNLKAMLSDFGIDYHQVPQRFFELKEKYKLFWLVPSLFNLLIKFHRVNLGMLKLECENVEYFTFNDEELIFRYVLDKIDSYTLVQEGLANYLSFSDRNKNFNLLSKWIKFIRFPFIPLGRNKKCKKIYYTDLSSDIPDDIKFKSEIINLTHKFTNSEIIQLKKYFCVESDIERLECIILTQPLEVYGIASSDKVKLYYNMYLLLIKKFKKVAIKVHPRDNRTDYNILFKNILGTYPVEILSEFNESIRFFSIFSSGGGMHNRAFESADIFDKCMRQQDFITINNNITKMINSNA